VPIATGSGGHPEIVDVFNVSFKSLAHVNVKKRDVVASLVSGPPFAGWGSVT
jgi:hypothetical protein